MSALSSMHGGRRGNNELRMLYGATTLWRVGEIAKLAYFSCSILTSGSSTSLDSSGKKVQS
jgi:hypothetical protein